MPLKILQISPFAFDHPGGVEQYARTLQELFPAEMESLSGGEDFPIIEPVKHFPFPAFWKKWFWNIFREIRKDNTKIIVSHIRFAPTAWFAFFIAKRRGIPYIHIEHGTGFLVHKNPYIAWVAKMVDLTIGKYIIRHADTVICISQAGKKWVSETFWRKHIEVIYRGFEFPKGERVKNIVPKIGFVGRLTGLKNVAGLIEALGGMKTEKWICEIVGEGEEKANLVNLVTKLWLEERIIFLWVKSHEWIMSEFYPNIDIFVNPSLQEWLPTTVIEALGMGCHVIATDVGGTREIENIELIAPWNTEALIHSLLRALTVEKDKDSPIGHQFSIALMRKWFSLILGIG
jgi:glycosyltransferase involved in cell wall biosynthesis